MIRFLDGPAGGQSLLLKRAPMFLRVVIDRTDRKLDALDQLDDQPSENEDIYVYRLEGETSWVHLNMGRRGSGYYVMGSYRHVPDADGEALRSTDAWRDWVREQARVPA